MRKIVMAACALWLAACAPATVNKQGVRATDKAPESAQVDIVQIPYNPNRPYYVVTVEPFQIAADGSGSAPPPVPGETRYGFGSWGWGLLPTGPQAQTYNPGGQGMSGNIGPAVAAQLTTALSNAGNIRIIDWDFFQQNGGNPSKLVNKKAGEVGPFIVRGVVTEFSEIAEASGESTGGSLGDHDGVLSQGTLRDESIQYFGNPLRRPRVRCVDEAAIELVGRYPRFDIRTHDGDVMGIELVAIGFDHSTR